MALGGTGADFTAHVLAALHAVPVVQAAILAYQCGLVVPGQLSGATPDLARPGDVGHPFGGKAGFLSGHPVHRSIHMSTLTSRILRMLFALLA